MDRGMQGQYIKQGSGLSAFKAFDPKPLPPDPSLELSAGLSRAISRADQMLGRLDGLSSILRHPDLLIYFYIRKEAVLSSQIEGTQSTLSELLLFEAEPELRNDDIVEVLNYVAAMRHGLERLSSGFPLSLRLIKEMHEHLLREGRGSDRTPGEFRRSQNWIGGTYPGNALYVPPPVPEMNAALDYFEKFMNGAAEEMPILIQCALLHLQFETIHPFLDGNGRLGRLLMTMLLVQRGVLTKPLLYMSLYLKQNKARYYELLQEVRFKGNWEEWVLFFVEGVTITAERAVTLARQILDLFQKDEDKVQTLGPKRGSALQVLQALQHSPYSSAKHISEKTGLAFNTCVSSMQQLESLGIVHEITGRERKKTYRYSEYVTLLDQGTDLP
ncbi:Fic family protein [Terriglobus sp. RCC_193]|uniref:Fic family protein n=1 Tax=Terriglobus sp. RCC_193 TaxID=3239218 RepID=UPI00352444C4